MQTPKWDAFRQLNARYSWHPKDDPFHPLLWDDSYCDLLCSADNALRPKEPEMDLTEANQLYTVINDLRDKNEISLEGANRLSLIIDTSTGIRAWLDATKGETKP